MNLLPRGLARREEHCRQAKKWLLAWSVVAAFLGAGHATLALRCETSSQAIQALDSAVEQLHSLERQTIELQQVSSHLEQALARQADLQQREHPLTLLQVVCDSFLQAERKVWLDSYRMEEITPPITCVTTHSAPSTATATARKQLVISGSADSDVSVSEVVQKLRDSGAFHTVDLIGSQIAGDATNVHRTFELHCQQ